MSIIVNKDTRFIIQGITGLQGRVHARLSLEYGCALVGGVTPGKGGQTVEGLPVFDTVEEARDACGDLDATMILVPPAGVCDSAAEAMDNGIRTIVPVTEFVPVKDTLLIRDMAATHGATVIGPNTIGVISPGKSKIGIMPGFLYSEGHVGIVSRSGTLTHEVASCLSYRGVGQSTCVGIGGDPVPGSSFTDILTRFKDDEETECVVLIGEIGGCGEEMAAEYLKQAPYGKPVFAFIAGNTAPAMKKMGHAGAIVAGNAGTVRSKREALQSAGVVTTKTLEELLDLTCGAVGKNKGV